MTSRRLARDLALEWLEESAQPSAATPLPVFIKCARDIRDKRYDHAQITRHALWEQAADILGRERPSMSHPMFEALAEDVAALFILDGLDEVAMSKNQIEDLFHSLRQELGSRQRAIIFTRPGALHDQRCVPEDTPVVALQAFDEARIRAWAERWNLLQSRSSRPDSQPAEANSRPGAALSLERLHEHGLEQLAATPILLLMIAVTWEEYAYSTEPVAQVELYEHFMKHVAHGKYEGADPDEHEGVRQASEKLAYQLRRAGELAYEDAVEAMLWLMSRVSWEAHVYTYEKDKKLQTKHIERILEEELKLDGTDLATIHLGVLLAMQVDPAGGTSAILFGHQSFREFLVARFWKHQLCALSQGRPSRERIKAIEDRLMRTELGQPGDHAFDMLLAMLAREDESSRQAIRSWASTLRG